MEAIDDFNKFKEPHIDHVITNEHGVLLFVDGLWFGVEAMQASPKGFLVREEGVWMPLSDAIKSDTAWTWRCQVCGYTNLQGEYPCKNIKNHSKK